MGGLFLACVLALLFVFWVFGDLMLCFWFKFVISVNSVVVSGIALLVLLVDLFVRLYFDCVFGGASGYNLLLVTACWVVVLLCLWWVCGCWCGFVWLVLFCLAC